MKFIIFTTNRKEANRISKSLDMAFVLFEITANLRKRTEWALENVKDPYDAHEKIFDAIYDLLDEHGIVIDELIE